MGLFDIFRRNREENRESLDQGLDKTRTSLLGRIGRAITGKSTIDDEVLDQLEEAFVTSDVGVETTVKLIDRLRKRVAKDKFSSQEEFTNLLYDEIANLLTEGRKAESFDFQVPEPTHEGKRVPYVIMVVGVNGVGKTTTIGKLAGQFRKAGLKVVLGAADTFRAAAVEQLKIWGTRSDSPVIAREMGSDPSSVAFDAVKAGVDLGAEVVIVDTAGRLHNKKHLMEELAKVRRVMAKVVPDAPHEVLLVLDASTGQNALQQCKEFTEFTQVTALALTKLDGTAKGGVVISLCDQFRIPVKYIGVGERLEDLQLFDPRAFAESLLRR
jgi:fused signal recognition particle receptor